MKSFEQPRQSIPNKAEGSPTIAENSVQKALMHLWAEQSPEKFADNNAIAMEWISGGMAERFRDYVDSHAEEHIDLENEEELATLLDHIQEDTVH